MTFFVTISFNGQSNILKIKCGSCDLVIYQLDSNLHITTKANYVKDKIHSWSLNDFQSSYPIIAEYLTYSNSADMARDVLYKYLIDSPVIRTNLFLQLDLYDNILQPILLINSKKNGDKIFKNKISKEVFQLNFDILFYQYQSRKPTDGIYEEPSIKDALENAIIKNPK